MNLEKFVGEGAAGHSIGGRGIFGDRKSTEKSRSDKEKSRVRGA